MQYYRKLFATAIIAIVYSASLLAMSHQDASVITDTVKAYLKNEIAGLPGSVDIQIGSVDARLTLAECSQLQAFTPPGARLWGSATVGVRCIGATPWALYVPVEIQVTGSYLVTAHPLAAGQTLTENDFVIRRGNLTQLPPGIAVSPEQVIGKIMSGGIASGEPLRQDMLRAPVIVQSNQPVKVISHGAGFVVSGEGRALTSAADGQTVQVRTLSGQVIAGIVRPGPLVEVMF